MRTGTHRDARGEQPDRPPVWVRRDCAGTDDHGSFGDATAIAALCLETDFGSEPIRAVQTEATARSGLTRGFKIPEASVDSDFRLRRFHRSHDCSLGRHTV